MQPMNKRAVTIHVVPRLNSLLEDALYQVQTTLTVCDTPSEAQRKLQDEDYCLIVLDSFSLTTERARASVERMRLTTNAPILILAPPEASKLLLKTGADICVPEHVTQDSIVSHALALLRRYTVYDRIDETKISKRAFQEGDIFIDPLRHAVTVRGRAVSLRPREFSLLLYFMQNPNIVLSSEQICEHAWGMEGSYNQGISGPVAILRKAIEPDPAHPKYIETVSRMGYRFTAYLSETCDICSGSVGIL